MGVALAPLALTPLPAPRLGALCGAHTQEYSRDLFLFLFALLVIVAGATSMQPVRTPLLLNRPQTEEWKGWMQVREGVCALMARARAHTLGGEGGCGVGTRGTRRRAALPAVQLLPGNGSLGRRCSVWRAFAARGV